MRTLRLRRLILQHEEAAVVQRQPPPHRLNPQTMILEKSIRLTPNPHWPIPAQISKTRVVCRRNHAYASFQFDVVESDACFRCQCQNDGDPCWQDSCVEIFVASSDRRAYWNFETNARARMLVQFGSSRSERVTLKPEDYAAVRRFELIPFTQQPDGMYHWAVQIDIPLEWLGFHDFTPFVGNLYKCASLARAPHYLALFPIDTPDPDFHRPEFFKNIFI